MDHVARPLHVLLAKKEERIWFNNTCFKLYQFERTTWWCLYVLEFVTESILEFILEISLQYVMKFVVLENIQKVTVSRNLRQTHLLEAGLTEIPGDHKIISIIRHVGLLVDFSSMRSSLGL